MEPHGTGPTVTCHVRASEPTSSTAEDTVAALRRHLDEGRLDGVVVRTWPSVIALSGATRESEAVAAFESFVRWAERTGRTIRPPFGRETRASTITGESREVIVTPAVCVATYPNGQLVAVHPHSDGDGRHPVGEALDAIRADRYRPNVPALVEATGDPDRCPACAERLVDGQGLYACSQRDCDWVGVALAPGEYRTDLGARSGDQAALAARHS